VKVEPIADTEKDIVNEKTEKKLQWKLSPTIKCVSRNMSPVKRKQQVSKTKAGTERKPICTSIKQKGNKRNQQSKLVNEKKEKIMRRFANG